MSEVEKILESCRGEDSSACQATCPAHIDAKGYIAKIAEGDFRGAIEIVREVMPFVGVCGRVCNHPCEMECERGTVDEPVAIRALKRFIGDYEIENGREKTIPYEKTREEKVAIIGSGPAGLTAAYFLIQSGYQVTVFEKLPVVGGMMRVGIPEYRLPREILVNEIQIIEQMGVTIRTNVTFGRDITLESLKENGFDAVLLAVGLHGGQRLGVENEDAEGVLQGIYFLRHVAMGEDVPIGDDVLVIGGGNVAIDVALTAKRKGAKNVNVVCLEKRDEMPAWQHEIEEALEENINIVNSFGPKSLLVDKNGHVSGIEFKFCAAVFDEQGLFDPQYDESVCQTLFCDTVIIAIGQSLDITSIREQGITITPIGALEADPVTLQTRLEGVFAAGDANYGPKSVIEAVAAGKEAAISIDRYLKGVDLSEGRPVKINRLKEVSTEGVEKKARVVIPKLEVSKREGFAEVEQVLNEQAAIDEAKRCLACECKQCMTECEFLRRYCESPKDFALRFLAGDFNKKPHAPFCCNLCELCEKLCPEDINVGRMCIEARRAAVTSGAAPFGGHQVVLKDQAFVRSDEFKMTVPNPGKRKVRRIFFPGCHLSAYRPSLIISAYEWLRGKDPDTGIMLRCCGAPTNGMGFLSDFNEMMAELEAEVESLGAEEIITACPNCFRTLSRFSEKLNPISLYDVMAAEWEEGVINTAEGGVFNLHDPCAGRFHTSAHDTARKLVKYTGAQIEELEHIREDTRCCGMGGMIAFTSPELAGTLTKRRVAEASLDLITYCATCQGSLAAQKPTIHILDLIFNPNWREDKALPPNKPPVKKENQLALKKHLKDKYSDEV